MLWATPAFKRLLEKHSSVVIDMCAFGAAWKKPTRLLTVNCSLNKFAGHICRSKSGCSFTGLPHEILSGRSAEHKCLWTQVASAYPPLFADQVVAELARNRHFD